MFKDIKEVKAYIKKNNIEFVDFKMALVLMLQIMVMHL